MNIHQLITGRSQPQQVDRSVLAFRPANDDSLAALTMPDIRSVLTVIPGSKEAIVARVVEDAAAVAADISGGNIRGAVLHLARAAAGVTGMLSGALLGAAIAGNVGSMIGMTLGGSISQYAAKYFLQRASA